MIFFDFSYVFGLTIFPERDVGSIISTQYRYQMKYLISFYASNRNHLYHPHSVQYIPSSPADLNYKHHEMNKLLEPTDGNIHQRPRLYLNNYTLASVRNCTQVLPTTMDFLFEHKHAYSLVPEEN